MLDARDRTVTWSEYWEPGALTYNSHNNHCLLPGILAIISGAVWIYLRPITPTPASFC